MIKHIMYKTRIDKSIKLHNTGTFFFINICCKYEQYDNNNNNRSC